MKFQKKDIRKDPKDSGKKNSFMHPNHKTANAEQWSKV